MKIRLLAAILVLAGIGVVCAEPVADASDARLITVLNPAVSDQLAERVPLAPRLDKLEGKTIYLVDTNYEGMGPAPVLEEMHRCSAGTCRA